MKNRLKNTNVIFALVLLASLVFGYLLLRNGHSTEDAVEKTQTQSLEEMAARRFYQR